MYTTLIAVIITVIVLVLLLSATAVKLLGGFYTAYRGKHSHIYKKRYNPRDWLNDITEYWRGNNTADKIREKWVPELYVDDIKYLDILLRLWPYVNTGGYVCVTMKMNQLERNSFVAGLAEACIACHIDKRLAIYDFDFEEITHGTSNVIIPCMYMNEDSFEKKQAVLRILMYNRYFLDFDGWKQALNSNKLLLEAFKGTNTIVEPIYGSNEIRYVKDSAGQEIHPGYWYLLPKLNEFKSIFYQRTDKDQAAIKYIQTMKRTLSIAHKNNYMYVDWKIPNFMVEPVTENVYLADIDFSDINGEKVYEVEVSMTYKSTRVLHDNMCNYIIANRPSEEWIRSYLKRFDNHAALYDATNVASSVYAKRQIFTNYYENLGMNLVSSHLKLLDNIEYYRIKNENPVLKSVIQLISNKVLCDERTKWSNNNLPIKFVTDDITRTCLSALISALKHPQKTKIYDDLKDELDEMIDVFNEEDTIYSMGHRIERKFKRRIHDGDDAKETYTNFSRNIGDEHITVQKYTYESKK